MTFHFFRKTFVAMWSTFLFLTISKEKYVFSRRFSFKGKMPDYSSDCFLVGAFPLREKCPTIAVTVFCRRFSIKGKMPDYSSDCFLVGAFPLREKCPTIAVTVF